LTVDLNSEQLAGVKAINGNTVMIAGPGSGKTRVLTERYKEMRLAGIYDRDILNLTFTNSASVEMAERAGLLNASQVFRTFHSFCLDFLKHERMHLPFRTCPTIIPVRGEQFALYKDLLRIHRCGNYEELTDAIATWKARNVGPEKAMDEIISSGQDNEEWYRMARSTEWAKANDKAIRMASAYADYEKKCREQGWLDFDGIMKETVKILENKDEVRAKYKRKYLAVDECQDTDTTQFKLLQLLYDGNIFAVGDENQLIYEWRSAVAGSLSNFSRTFPGSKTLYLGTNYRSTPELVDFCKAILPVDNGIASYLVSARPVSGKEPRIIRYLHEDDEANVVLDTVVQRGIQADSAILARTNRQLQLIQRRALSRNIKTEIAGKKNVWQEYEVRHLLDLLKERFADPRPAAEVMTELIHNEGMIERYSGTRKKADKDPVENLNDIVKIAGRRKRTTQQPQTVPEFLEWTNKIMHMRRTKAEPILTLSTVHQAKGLEWKYVFLVGCNEGLLPHKEGELMEERRIFFVACSRAADELQISYTERHSQFLNDFEEDFEEFEYGEVN